MTDFDDGQVVADRLFVFGGSQADRDGCRPFEPERDGSQVVFEFGNLRSQIPNRRAEDGIVGVIRFGVSLSDRFNQSLRFVAIFPSDVDKVRFALFRFLAISCG